MSPDGIREFDFPAGLMGRRVDAACQFAERTGMAAAIGTLADLPAIVRGEAGATVTGDVAAIEWH